MDNKDYSNLENLFRNRVQLSTDNDKMLMLLLLEVKNVRKKLTSLPTSREMEAEPELRFLREASGIMLSPEFAEVEEMIYKNERLEKLFFEDLLAGSCADFLKTRIYTNKTLIHISDEMISNLVAFCTKRLYLGRHSLYFLLNTILDKQQEFYKNNGKETNLFAWAFGSPNELDNQLKRWIDGLQKGDQIDVLKSFGGKQNWTRGIFEARDPSFTKIKYLNESSISFLMNPYLEIRPFKSMSSDYEWREELKEGDLVDFHSFRSGWILARVTAAHTIENYEGDKVRQVELKREIKGDDGQSGKNQQPTVSAGYINMNYYDEFSSPVKQQIHSPIIAKPNTLSLRSSSQIDDSFDANFELPEHDPRVAIIRPNNSSGISSTYFVKYLNLFSQHGGFAFVERVLCSNQPSDLFSEAVFLLKNSAESLLKSFIDRKGKQLTEALLKYHSEFIEKNIRLFSQHYLSNFIEAVSSLYLREYKSVDASSLILDLIIRSGIVCLKSEILEKQFFGAKLILSYESQLRESVNRRFQDTLVAELLSDNLLEKLLKGHPSLIAKSSGIVKCLFSGNYLLEEHVDVMWNLVVKADSESRSALVSLIKDLASDMQKDHVRLFCKKILENSGELTVEVLELVELFRRIGVNRFEDKEVAALVNAILWKSLQSERDVRKEVGKELTKVFVRYVKNDQLDAYLPRIIENIVANINRMRNFKLLVTFLKEAVVSTSSLGLLLRESKLFDCCVADICEKIKQISQRNQKGGSMQQLPSTKQGELNLSAADLQSEIRKILKLMRLLLFSKYLSLDEELFSFKHFELIYDELFRCGLLEKSIQEWLIDYISQTHSESLHEKSSNFFIQKLSQIDELGREDFLVFFVAIFKKINIRRGMLVERFIVFQSGRIDYRNKTQLVCEKHGDSFFGIELLWDLYLRTTNRKLFRKLAQLLSKVYLVPEYSDVTDFSLYAAMKDRLANTAIELMSRKLPLDAQKAALLLIEIIRKDLNKRESFGFSMAQLRESDKLFFSVEKDSKYIRDRFKVKTNANSTIQDLKVRVSDQYKVAVSRVSLCKSDGKEISDYDNFQTLENMAVKDNDILLYVETNVPQLPDIEILNSTKTEFSAQLKQVWKEIFEEFSTDGLMSKSEFGNLTAKATNASPTKNIHLTEKIREIFSTYGINDGTFLTFDGLLAFYTESMLDSFEKSKIVRDNLKELGYDKDFKLKKHRHQLKETTSFRWQLANNSAFMTDLFEVIALFRPSTDESEVDTDLSFVMRLLDLLPPPETEIQRLFANPAAYFKESSKGFLWNYKATLLHAILFRKEFVDDLLMNMNLDSQFSSATMIERVANREFFDVVFGWMSRATACDSIRNNHFSLIMSVFLIDKILRSLVEIKEKEFSSIYTEFYTFFSKRKQKQSTDKPTEETPTSNFTQMITHSSLTETILSSIDFPSLNETLLSLLLQIARVKSPIHPSLKTLLKSSVFSLISSICLSKQSFKELVATEVFRELMLEGLTNEVFLFKMFLSNLCLAVAYLFNDVKVKIALLKVLIANIKLKKGEESLGLVEPACGILAEIGEMKALDAHVAHIIHEEFNFTSLFLQFKEELLAHKSKETPACPTEDAQLIGLLAFLEKIVIADEVILTQVDQQAKLDFIHHLFSDCLFKVENKSIEFLSVKCHSSKSRRHAFGLLVQLLRNNIRLNIHFMVKEVSPLVRHIPSLTWASANSNESRLSPNGYVGVQNLGCICYMIATLQQFYCIPAFRYGILMADDHMPATPSEVKGMQLDDNYFHQFQRLMSYLDISDRRKTSPFDFCLSYKDYSGNPVNIAIQQDADEFLKIFLDKMEHKLKGTPFLGAINSVCLGQIVNKIKCQSCGHVKLNTENFYNLSLEVKGMKGISESLDKLIEPEIISDYMCDSCKKKSDISKQVLLEDLPNMLFLSLKKMYFDLELLANVKLHSRYEFPMVINLRKYMHIPEVDAGVQLDDADFEYQVKGVIIHKGNAEYGHYTSLIKADPLDPARKCDEGWFEFDDSKVTPFEMKKFEEECFGPTEDKDMMTMLATEMDSSKSAYLLVFEKTRKKDIVFEFNEQNAHLKEFIIDHLTDKTAHSFEDNKLRTGFHNLRQFIPTVYKQEVENDNKTLTLEQNLLCRTFTKSIAEIFWNVDLSVPDNSPDLAAILIDKRAFAETVLKNLPQLLSKVYCVSSENENIYQVVSVIERSLSFFAGYALLKPEQKPSIDSKLTNFFIEQILRPFSSIQSAILNSTDANVQFGLIDYVAKVTGVVIRHYGIINFENTNKDDESPVEKFRCAVSQILLTLILSMTHNEDTIVLFRKFGRIFALSCMLAKDNLSVIQFFVHRNLFQHLQSVYFKFDNSKIHSGEKTAVWIIKLSLLMYTYIVGYAKEHSADKLASLAKLELLIKASKEDYRFEDYETLRQTAYVFCFNDKSVSEAVTFSMLKSAGMVMNNEFGGCLEVLKAMLMIQDSFQNYRIQCVLGVPRLCENSSYGFYDERRYLYGLARESSLKKPMVAYLNPFGLDKGLLELIISNRDYYESQTMMLLQFLLSAMLTNDHVLNYVMRLPSPNYISASFIDWFYSYAIHHDKKELTEYNSFKFEFSKKVIADVLEKVKQVEQKIIDRYNPIVSTNKRIFSFTENPYQSYYNFYTVDRIDQQAELLWSLNQPLIIGKTLGFELMRKIVIEESISGQLKVKFWLLKFLMMESLPDGRTNYAFPDSIIYSDLTLRISMGSSSPLLSFFSPFVRPEGYEPTGIHGILEDDNEQKPVEAVKSDTSKQSKRKFELPNNPQFMNVRYALRISVTNTTNESHYVKLSIGGSNGSNFEECEITAPIQGRKHDHLVHTVCLFDPKESFVGMTVKLAHKSVDYCNMKYYDDRGYKLATEQFNFTK